MDRTFSSLLGEYNRSKIARQLGVPRSRVNRWAAGDSFPEVQHLPRLAEILRVDVAELAAIIAADAHRGAAAVAS